MESNVKRLQTDLERKMKWLMYMRWALYVVVFLSVLINKPAHTFIYYLLLVYGATTAGYLVVLSSHKWKQNPLLVQLIRILPITFEIIVEIVLIHMTGGVQSPYLSLLVLSIVTAAFIYRLTGTLVVTTFASVLFGLMVYAQWRMLVDFDLTVPVHQSIYANSDALWASVYVFVIVLYIIALLAGYLSRRLHYQIKRIQSLDKEISGLRMRTGEIMERLPSGVIIYDEQMQITYFNKTARKLLGIGRDEPLEGHISAAVEGSFPELINLIVDFEGKNLRRELVLKKDDNRHIVKASITDLSLEDMPPGTMIVLEDITNEKHRQSLIEETKRLAVIGDISARFAHEIRNPLASIRGSVEMLMGNMNLPPEDQRLFELVIRESDRLTNFLEDFLIFARLKELPDSQFRRDSVDLGALFDEILLLTSSHPAFHEGISVANNIKQGKLFVQGEAEQLSKAFSNILINAYQAMKGISGEISVSLAPKREELFSSDPMTGIVISDQGKGMNEDELESLFTPFISSKSYGVGLGMAITNSIVNKHNGYIEVRSEKGVGTTFIVYLETADMKQENLL